jgi:2,4-dienoyl-CoA reductase-like NADH-dependent reductase (Old Yellow Enzyme family)
MPVTIETPLTLPCGSVLPNRLIKAAMTEGLADTSNNATDRHLTLYRRWSEGGAGLLLTGNVQIDRRHIERPGNVVIEGPPNKEAMDQLKRWAQAATSAGNQCWMQLSHAGRQIDQALNPHPFSASATQVVTPGMKFGKARAMTEAEIATTIEHFGSAARAAREAEFTGVELHGAHGYLVAQFLSPLTNLRTDDWGGSLENRARFLLEVVRAMRAQVGPDFPIGVKLNSSDFQKGGFTFAECQKVVIWLGDANIDLLEISGGNHEHLRYFDADGMTVNDAEENVRESTKARESYFVDYAASIAPIAKMPVMATGGFRTRAAMDEALSTGAVDLIGLGRPMCAEPDTPRALLSGELAGFIRWEDELRLGGGWLGPASRFPIIRAVNAWGAASWFLLQIHRIANGDEPTPATKVLGSFLEVSRREKQALKAYRAANPLSAD